MIFFLYMFLIPSLHLILVHRFVLFVLGLRFFQSIFTSIGTGDGIQYIAFNLNKEYPMVVATQAAVK